MKSQGKSQSISEVETGKVCEHDIVVIDNNDKKRKWRRITVHLNKETRDGDDKITLLTNLPKSSATAEIVANLYRKRWSIETMFQELEATFTLKLIHWVIQGQRYSVFAYL